MSISHFIEIQESIKINISTNVFEKIIDFFKIGYYIITMNESNWGGRRKGSGRKATGKKTATLSITLPIEEVELLKKYAKDSKLSVSKFISKVLGLAKSVEKEFER